LQLLAHVIVESLALDTADVMTTSSSRAAHRDFSGSMFCRNTHTFMSIAVCYRVREEMAGNSRQLHSVGLHYVLCGCHVKELGSYVGQQKYAEIFDGEI
jgi:hypothetical protein